MSAAEPEPEAPLPPLLLELPKAPRDQLIELTAKYAAYLTWFQATYGMLVAGWHTAVIALHEAAPEARPAMIEALRAAMQPTFEATGDPYFFAEATKNLVRVPGEGDVIN